MRVNRRQYRKRIIQAFLEGCFDLFCGWKQKIYTCMCVWELMISSKNWSSASFHKFCQQSNMHRTNRDSRVVGSLRLLNCSLCRLPRRIPRGTSSSPSGRRNLPTNISQKLRSSSIHQLLFPDPLDPGNKSCDEHTKQTKTDQSHWNKLCDESNKQRRSNQSHVINPTNKQGPTNHIETSYVMNPTNKEGPTNHMWWTQQTNKDRPITLKQVMWWTQQTKKVQPITCD